jgi:hypothetical protein
LNMHGTRAVQKMIEFLTLPEQVKIRYWGSCKKRGVDQESRSHIILYRLK